MKLYMKGSLRGDVDAQKVLDLFPKDEGRGIRVTLAGRLKLGSVFLSITRYDSQHINSYI
jgi:hypothetical protein